MNLLMLFFRQQASKDLLSSSPVSEVNAKILADLENNRTNLTSEGSRTDDQYSSMGNRQPDANQNGVERHDSLSNGSSGNLSPGPFTSFQGLNIIASTMGKEGEGEKNKSFFVSFFFEHLVSTGSENHLKK